MSEQVFVRLEIILNPTKKEESLNAEGHKNIISGVLPT